MKFTSFVPVAFAFIGAVSARPFFKRDATQDATLIMKGLATISNDVTTSVAGVVTLVQNQTAAAGKALSGNLNTLLDDITGAASDAQGVNPLDTTSASIIEEFIGDGLTPQLVTLANVLTSEAPTLGNVGTAQEVSNTLTEIKDAFGSYAIALAAVLPANSTSAMTDSLGALSS